MLTRYVKQSMHQKQITAKVVVYFGPFIESNRDKRGWLKYENFNTLFSCLKLSNLSF